MTKSSLFLLMALLALACVFTAQAVAEAVEPVPAIDPTQTRYTDEPIATPTPAPGTEAEQSYFTLYCLGDVFEAASGSGTAACDVRNKPDSTHDIRMQWLITAGELEAHGLSTEGLDPENGCWTIAQTGLFEPGYRITEVQLLPLPDGSFLPAGEYHMLLTEDYFHHITGEKHAYQSNIPITLTIRG